MISAILLAAGQSKRMGELKQLLPFGSETIIERSIQNLLRTRIDELIVVLGHRAGEVAERISRLPVTVAINEAYLEGMTSSVQIGLAAVNPEAGAFLLALVDQPRIPPSIIDRLIDLYRQSGAKIVKPRYQGQSGHPVIIDLTLRDEILRLPPSVGLNQVTRAHSEETIYMDVDSSAVVEDIDTPEDYRRIVGEVEGSP
jgi:molybdenum cofactor cytidylyltransferase